VPDAQDARFVRQEPPTWDVPFGAALFEHKTGYGRTRGIASRAAPCSGDTTSGALQLGLSD
jgi:hypothetical protein